MDRVNTLPGDDGFSPSNSKGSHHCSNHVAHSLMKMAKDSLKQQGRCFGRTHQEVLGLVLVPETPKSSPQKMPWGILELSQPTGDNFFSRLAQLFITEVVPGFWSWLKHVIKLIWSNDLGNGLRKKRLQYRKRGLIVRDSYRGIFHKRLQFRLVFDVPSWAVCKGNSTMSICSRFVQIVD